MKKIINSKVVPLPIENIDTDQIIPAQFLKSTSKDNFGKNLFYHWRYDSNGQENPDFILNQDKYREAKILLAGNNFGCGSSREHAAWALKDFGIDVVISTQFADIFKVNAYNNQILPIEFHKSAFDQILSKVNNNTEIEIEVNIENQSLGIPNEDVEFQFALNSYHKDCLLHNLDETDYLIKIEREIEIFENGQ